MLSWQNVLRFSLIPALFFALMIFMMMRNIPTDDEGTKSAGEYFSGLLELLKKKLIIALVLLTALRSMGQTAVTAFLPLYLRADLDYSPLVVGLYLSGSPFSIASSTWSSIR